MSAPAPTLQAFFTDRLIAQRHASGHTIAAYRDTRRPLLGYAADQTCVAPSALNLADLDATLIAGFLDHLETERGNSVRTRNARLAAIHSLFRYAALTHPEHAETIARVLAIPPKRCDRALVDRITPLTRGTLTVLHGWLDEHHGQPSDPLFPTRRGEPAQPRRHRAPHRPLRRAGRRRLPIATSQTDQRARAPAHHRDAAAACRRRHQRHRALARPRQVDTTQIYLHADLELKEKALARTRPPSGRTGRYRPPRQPARLARRALIMPTSPARNPGPTRETATSSA